MKIIEQQVNIVSPRSLERGIEELQLIEIAGRNCWRSEGKMTDDSYRSFLENLRKRGHESPIEFAHVMYDITTSRDVMAELTRHRLASFCVSGDTVISYDNKTKGCTIRELYNKTDQYRHMMKIRSIDESNRQIVFNQIENVFFNGYKQTYSVETIDGYTIRATCDHKFLTPDGWKELRELSVGDCVYTNGVEAYKQKEIADICNVSHHTIRSWIRKFGLQKPSGSWNIGRKPPNKGRTKDDYAPLMVTSQKMHQLRTCPELGYTGGRKKQTINEAYGQKNNASSGYDCVYRLFERKNICAICGEHCDYTEVHHIDKNPQNFSPENLVELCPVCHKRIHLGASVKAVKPSVIKSITLYGEEDVYDIEMKAPYHNYVANGFVVHNCIESQRYVNESKDEGGIKFIRPLFYKEFDPYYDFRSHIGFKRDPDYEASRKWDDEMELAEDAYNQMIGMGMKNQDARKVLPNSTACRIMMKVNLRELLHIYRLRSSPAAYPEMRQLMRLLKTETDKIFPGFLPDTTKECEDNQ